MYPIEFINSLEINNFPSHNIKLKQNCIIILLRNLNPIDGLCNGTRLIVNQITNRIIFATIINGPNSGSNVFIPKINLISDHNVIPIQFKRFQFPIKIAYCMTINKSQGQTLNTMGLFLKPKPVFVHGQLNVALTRVTSQDGIKIFIINHGKYKNDNNTYTKNIVYKEIL